MTKERTGSLQWSGRNSQFWTKQSIYGKIEDVTGCWTAAAEANQAGEK